MHKLNLFIFLISFTLSFFMAPVFSSLAHAQAFKAGEVFLEPRLGAGFNPGQGNYYMAGLDLGYAFSDNVAGGVHGYYSAGETPQHDRDMGVGPFAVYVQPLTSFLTAHVRQEVNYVNQRDRIITYSDAGKVYSHSEDTGSASVTAAGLHLSLGAGFGVSLGYRLVLGLTNDDVGRKRSGTFIGITIGL